MEIKTKFFTIKRKIEKKIQYHYTNIKTCKYRLEGKQIIHFLHIGKTGGTAFREALTKHNINNNYAIIFHQHEIKLKDIPKGEKVIFFLRDPLTRFVSGFYSRQRKRMPRYNIPWKGWEEKAFSIFHTPNDLAEAITSKNKIIRKEAIHAMQNITHIKSHFWDWFSNKKYFQSRLNDILFVATQENLSRDFEKLKTILKLPKNLKLPKDDYRMHKNPLHLNKKLSQTAKHNLKKWYAKDYEFSKLCKKENLI